MARLSYGAPGVYVEEIPSARQPIAGVGTNTVAFIGLVPGRIHCPVPNPDYDPVEGKRAASATPRGPATAAQPGGASESRVNALNDDVKKLENELSDRQKQENTAKAEQAKPGQEAKADELAKAVAKAAAAREDVERRLAVKKKERDDEASKGTKPSAAQERGFDNREPPKDLLEASEIRPYRLEEVEVKAPPLDTKLCTNFTEYTRLFGDFSAFGDGPLYPGHHYLTHAVRGFFDNGGTRAFVIRIEKEGDLQKALDQIESIDEVSIIAAPGLPWTQDNWEPLQKHCEHPDHQNVFAVLDCPATVGGPDGSDMVEKLQLGSDAVPRKSNYAAYYFPHIEVQDPAKRLQDDDPARDVAPKYRGRTYVPPSGHIAGVYARIDEERGVHKAPANTIVRGALEVKYYISKPKQELLNPHGINCLRIFDGAVTVWGARTIGGARNGEWKYINVRRFAGFLEESIDEGTQWVVFEPNDPSLWAKIRLNVSAFLTIVWRNGALVGTTPEEAFYVKCDAELNPPEVRDLGQVIIEIGVAIVRPAEFVIFRIAQFAGPQAS